MIGRALSRIVRFGRRDDGTVSFEFVILFPAFMGIFLAAFESGLLMVRTVMLERSVDLAVRELRLGTPTPPTFDEFKQSICARSIILGESQVDCLSRTQVQLQPVDMTTWGPLDETPRCIDIGSNINPIDATNYAVGQNNELMLVRVCALFRPFFPSTGMGLQLRYNDRGDYAIVATTAFVNEPTR
jgi:Flp pilus assembly protein TadG